MKKKIPCKSNTVASAKTKLIDDPITSTHKKIKERVEEFYKTDFETAVKENPYSFDEVDFGVPVGDEIW